MNRSAKFGIILCVILAVGVISAYTITSVNQNIRADNFSKELQKDGVSAEQRSIPSNTPVINIDKATFLYQAKIYNDGYPIVIRSGNSFYVFTYETGTCYCYTP